MALLIPVRPRDYDQGLTVLTKIQRCIAIVDDDPVVRFALSSLLRAAGYNVVLFQSGNDFLVSLFRGQRPDCVLLDFVMPGLSGLDVVFIMTVDRMDVPTIIITASDDVELESKFINAGAHALLRKPVSENQLFMTIASALAASANVSAAVH